MRERCKEKESCKVREKRRAVKRRKVFKREGEGTRWKVIVKPVFDLFLSWMCFSCILVQCASATVRWYIPASKCFHICLSEWLVWLNVRRRREQRKPVAKITSLQPSEHWFSRSQRLSHLRFTFLLLGGVSLQVNLFTVKASKAPTLQPPQCTIYKHLQVHLAT